MPCWRKPAAILIARVYLLQCKLPPDPAVPREGFLFEDVETGFVDRAVSHDVIADKRERRSSRLEVFTTCGARFCGPLPASGHRPDGKPTHKCASSRGTSSEVPRAREQAQPIHPRPETVPCRIRYPIETDSASSSPLVRIRSPTHRRRPRQSQKHSEQEVRPFSSLYGIGGGLCRRPTCLRPSWSLARP